MIGKIPKDEDAYMKLKNKVSALIQNTKYHLSLFQFNPNSFRGPQIELTDDRIVVRFFYDRGDIYRDKKTIDSDHWFDEQLVFSHQQKSPSIYDLLLSAIEDFINA